MQLTFLPKIAPHLLSRLMMLRWLAVLAVLWMWALWLAIAQPSLGTEFQAMRGQITIPARLAEPSTSDSMERLSALGVDTVVFQAIDFIEEPDQLNSYADWAYFYERQERIARLLTSKQVSLKTAAGQDIVIAPLQERLVFSLPFVFWFQLLVGAVGLLTGAWVRHLRPSETSSGYVLLSGFGLALAACSAAVYSTRELALPAATFSYLSAANHTGTVLFGIGLVNIFFNYPKTFAPVWLHRSVTAVFVVWLALDLTWLVPSPAWGTPIMTVAMLMLAASLGCMQWKRLRHDLLARTSFRWLTLSFLVGSGLFVGLIVITSLLGWETVVSQGYAFGFFLIMYFGLALAVARYRVFDLDVWSLRILMWLFGLLGILLLDSLLIYLRLSQTLSLVSSVLLCASIYFPLRQWLWQRLNHRHQPNVEVLIAKALAIALALPAERQYKWRKSIEDIFHPLKIQAAPPDPASQATHLLDEGLGICIYANAYFPSLWIWHKEAGRKLFSEQDIKTVEQLMRMVQMSIDARDAHELGVRQERGRIAQDLHDDLGAKLLTIAQTCTDPRTSQLAREATQEMRLTLKSLAEHSQALSALLADWRAETAQRLHAAGVQMQWHANEPTPDVVITARMQVQLTRILREAVSNLIRHAYAKTARVEFDFTRAGVLLRVHDDGSGFTLAADLNQPQPPTSGLGLLNIERRALLLGGKHYFGKSPLGGALVEVQVALQSDFDGTTSLSSTE